MLKKYQIFLLILLSYFTVLAFYPILSAGFIILDDTVMIQENPYIRSLSLGNIKAIFTEIYFKLYHPVVTVSYAVEYYFCGLDPYIYHLDNILLHLANTLLVFFLFKKFTKSFAVPYIAALIFAVHPVHTEVVAWATARKDILYSLFYLLSVLFYIKSYESKYHKTFITASLAGFLLSCLCKPAAVTLPAVLVLADYCQNRLDFKKIKIYIPFAVISAVFSWIAVAGHYSLDEKTISTSFVTVINVLNAHYNILFYLEKFIFPVNLSCLYPQFYNLFEMPPYFILYAPALLYLIFYAVILTLKINKKIFFGFLFFIAAVLPSSGIMPTGVAPAADRYVYLAYAGLSYVFAEFLMFLYKKFSRIKIFFIFAAIFLLSVLFYMTYTRTILWTDAEKLMTDAINKFPKTAEHAYISRAAVYMADGRFDLAESDLQKSLSINSNNGYTAFHLGHLAQIKKDYKKALKYYLSIPQSDANYIAVANNIAMIMSANGQDEQTVKFMEEIINLNNHIIYDYFYYNLATIYFKTENFEKAFQHLKSALDKNPHNEKYYLFMMELYMKSGDFQKAEQTALTGIKNAENPFAISDSLGKEYFLRGEYELAQQMFLHSVNSNSNDDFAYFMLGNLAALKGGYNEALNYYTIAIFLNKDEAEYYFKRGVVFFELKKYKLAKEDMEKAVKKGFNIDNNLKKEIENFLTRGEK